MNHDMLSLEAWFCAVLFQLYIGSFSSAVSYLNMQVLVETSA